jgi:antitoxin ParD1/3/4
MPAHDVDLTEHFDSFIDRCISSGRYSDASEVVCDGLRLLEEREAKDKAKLAWLRSVAQESFAALDRGEGIEVDSMDDLAGPAL